MRLSDRELMELQAEALFTFDEEGRMLRINEPDGGPAPRFFLGRTKAGHVWRFRHDLSRELARVLEDLARSEPSSGALAEYPIGYERILATLGLDAGGEGTFCGPAFYFPGPLEWPANAVMITRENAALVGRLFSWLPEHADRDPGARGPLTVVVADGAAVSVCFCSRLTARAAEAGVETLEAYRGRGYAGAAVAAWATAVRHSGRTPLYSTSWDNLASRAVARKLGLAMYGVDLSVD